MKTRLLVVLIAITILTACASPTPQIVVVTATPEPTATHTPVPTATKAFYSDYGGVSTPINKTDYYRKLFGGGEGTAATQPSMSMPAGILGRQLDDAVEWLGQRGYDFGVDYIKDGIHFMMSIDAVNGYGVGLASFPHSDTVDMVTVSFQVLDTTDFGLNKAVQFLVLTGIDEDAVRWGLAAAGALFPGGEDMQTIGGYIVAVQCTSVSVTIGFSLDTATASPAL